MPNKPRAENPNRNVRVPDDLWGRVREFALADRVTVSSIARTALREYVERRSHE